MTTPLQDAQEGIRLLKAAICRLLRDNPDGLNTSQIGEQLGINFANRKYKAFMPYYLLNELEEEQKVIGHGGKGRKGKIYRLA